MSSSTLSPSRAWAVRANRLVYWLGRHWLLVFGLFWALYVGLPWLAPVFMELGWTGAGHAIYIFYSFQCHQMPQRSFFLFGPTPMVSLSDVQAVWRQSNDPLVLRQFLGNEAMGWKVAWSDRMVYMYTIILPLAALFGVLRGRVKAISWRAFALFLLPMALDGSSHALSDWTGGIGGGFRYGNEWLAALTNHALPVSFYAGDALGSFNAWMRLLSGLFFAIGVVWFLFPQLQLSFAATARQIEAKFQNAGHPLEQR